MSKDMKIVQEMVDYVRQLRRHTEGRRSIHVKLSQLEKHFREEHYRRFTASALRPLVTNYGATMFALPNTDLVLIANGAPVETIDTLLMHVRRKFRESHLMADIDPVQGVSDAFVQWFNLETEYEDFRSYMEGLAEAIIKDAPPEAVKDLDFKPAKKSPGMLEISSRAPERLSPSAKVKMVPIEVPIRELEDRVFDPELVVQMVKAVGAADVGGMLRKQRVMAILPGGQKQDVMIHKYVPRDVVFEKLLEAPVKGENVWLDGYISDLLASRVLFSTPNMQNDKSIASSIRVTLRSIFDGSFDAFVASLGGLSKSKVIVELSAQDVLANFEDYHRAHARLDLDGFRLMLADVELTALLWLRYESFDADFVKTRLPRKPAGEWLSAGIEAKLKEQIKNIGQARVILDGCTASEDVELGMKLGITLFQGSAIEPYWV